MGNDWENFLLELALFSILGILYYFYQKKKILYYEKNKNFFIMNQILESCLSEKKDHPQPELDSLIESLDDFLQKKIPLPPLSLLKNFLNSSNCPKELNEIISEGIREIERDHEKR
jgi:hypothetical protein